MQALRHQQLRYRCQHAVHSCRRLQLVRTAAAAAPDSTSALTAEQSTGLTKQRLLYDGVSNLTTHLAAASNVLAALAVVITTS
jgi:hypothetical protein